METYSKWKLPDVWTFCILLVGSLAITIQLVLGTNLIILGLAISIVLLSLVAIWWKGFSNIGAVIVFLFGTNTVTFAILLKTLLLQRLDSDLNDPMLVFFVVLVGMIEILLAFIFVDQVRIKPIFKPCTDPRKLDIIGLASFLVGSLAWILNQLYSHGIKDFTVDDPGIGGFSLFRNLFILSVIAFTASTIQKTEGRKIISKRLILITILVVIMAFIDNQKTFLLQPFLAFILTAFFFRKGRISHHIIYGCIGMVLIGVYISPLVTYFRVLGLQGRSLIEKTTLIGTTISNMGMSKLMESARFYTKVTYSHGYYDYFGGDGQFQMLGGRFAAIQQIDPVIALTKTTSLFGWKPLLIAFQSIIPRIIFPYKDISNDAYYVVHKLGLSQWSTDPTVPVIAVAYATLGVPGLLIIPFVTFLAFFFVIKLIGWNLDRNIYTLFILCFMFPYIHEGSFQQYYNFIFRQIPTLIITILLITAITKIKFRQPHSFSQIN